MSSSHVITTVFVMHSDRISFLSSIFVLSHVSTPEFWPSVANLLELLYLPRLGAFPAIY